MCCLEKGKKRWRRGIGRRERRKDSREVKGKSNQSKIKVLEQKFRCLASTDKGKRSFWVYKPCQNIDFKFPHPYRQTHTYTLISK